VPNKRIKKKREKAAPLKRVKARRGQIIACEGEGHGDYLPFEPMRVRINNGGMNLKKKSTEFVYLGK
jgi:hypothetical protein